MFYFELLFLQEKGDRFYLDKDVKISLGVVNILKKMNMSYPKTSSDFDGEFLQHLLKSVFNEKELLECSSASSLKKLNGPKLKLAKGKNAQC